MTLDKRAAGAVCIAGRVARVAPGEIEIATRAARRRVALDAHLVIERGALRRGAYVAIDALPAQRLRQESLYREPALESVLEAARIVVGRPRRRFVAAGVLVAAAIGALAWPRAPTAQELTAPRCPPGTRRVTTPLKDRGWIHSCMARDRTREGPYTRWSEQRVKIEERWYRQGRIHGELRRWYPSGTIAQQTSYKDGRRHGPSAEWHVDGTGAAAGEYRHGEQHGAWWWRTGGRLFQDVFADGWPVSLPPVSQPPCALSTPPCND